MDLRLTIGHREIRNSTATTQLLNESRIEIKLKILGGSPKHVSTSYYPGRHMNYRDYVADELIWMPRETRE